MPFGLSNAPSTFQLAMSNILKNILNVFVYLDDILLFSLTYEKHVELVETVLRRLYESGASINYEKSSFGLDSVKYLGLIITPAGIKPDVSKIDEFSVNNIKTKKKLERLLGFLNWFRPFVKDISLITAKLYEKLKTEKRAITLSPEDHASISRIVDIIKSQPILYFPDFNTPFSLYCDASDLGIGSVLKQNNKIIGYFSKKYNKCENNYTIIEKEVLAILKSLQHFKQIIINTKVNIYTDNANIISQGDLSKRVNRWKLILEEYNYELHYIRGENNSNADFLSRTLTINNPNGCKKLNQIGDNDEVLKLKNDMENFKATTNASKKKDH
ncbi:Retrovirus-related Pol polyprotein from transposon 17.6 [Dictyocoela roeselum]|nr:Retrovirus-related Pol polyprotein from transposon 17.6 [Dictyocoela roeselum]